MITVCWAAKGGSGTTVVAAAMAIASSSPTLLVDLAGDVPAMLGMPEPDGAGRVRLAALRRPSRRGWQALEVDALTGMSPCSRAGGRRSRPIRGDGSSSPAGCASDSRRRDRRRRFGAEPPPAELVRGADPRLLVTRPCYLALRAACRHPARADGHRAGRGAGPRARHARHRGQPRRARRGHRAARSGGGTRGRRRAACRSPAGRLPYARCRSAA